GALDLPGPLLTGDDGLRDHAGDLGAPDAVRLAAIGDARANGELLRLFGPRAEGQEQTPLCSALRIAQIERAGQTSFEEGAERQRLHLGAVPARAALQQHGARPGVVVGDALLYRRRPARRGRGAEEGPLVAVGLLQFQGDETFVDAPLLAHRRVEG